MNIHFNVSRDLLQTRKEAASLCRLINMLNSKKNVWEKFDVKDLIKETPRVAVLNQKVWLWDDENHFSVDEY